MDKIDFSNECMDRLTFLKSQRDQSAHCVVCNNMTGVFAKEIMRVLLPGGFVFILSNSKDMFEHGHLLKDFKIIDTLAWLVSDNPDNSFSVNFLVERMQYLTEEERAVVRANVAGLRVPNLRKCFVPIIVAQRPVLRNKTINHSQFGVGLINNQRSAGGATVGNVFSTHWLDNQIAKVFMLPRLTTCEQETLTRMWAHVISQFTCEGTRIVDITIGADVAMACILTCRNYVGCEPDVKTYDRGKDRIEEFVKSLETNHHMRRALNLVTF